MGKRPALLDDVGRPRRDDLVVVVQCERDVNLSQYAKDCLGRMK